MRRKKLIIFSLIFAFVLFSTIDSAVAASVSFEWEGLTYTVTTSPVPDKQIFQFDVNHTEGTETRIVLDRTYTTFMSASSSLYSGHTWIFFTLCDLCGVTSPECISEGPGLIYVHKATYDSCTLRYTHAYPGSRVRKFITNSDGIVLWTEVITYAPNIDEEMGLIDCIY